jgi:hypothetical protein
VPTIITHIFKKKKDEVYAHEEQWNGAADEECTPVFRLR